MINLKQTLAVVLTVALIIYTLPRPVRAQSVQAAASAADVGATSHATTVATVEPLLRIALAPAATSGFAQADSTEFEFPAEDRSHLARDITIFVIVSVFVAFFIIKVFIEDEPDEPDDGGSGGGKGTP